MKFKSVDEIGPEHQGHRVTVRRKLRDGGYSDFIGIIEYIDISSIRVRNHKGEAITIPRSEIVAARVIEAPTLQNPENPASG